MSKLSKVIQAAGIAAIFSLILILSVVAHGSEPDEAEPPTQKGKLGVQLVIATTILVVIIIGWCSIVPPKSEQSKIVMFWLMAIAILGSSTYLVWDTINLNLTSETRGPVHWHADYEIWNCGEKVTLVDPEGLSNKIGNPVFHEHNDDRIHIEGVVEKREHVDVHNYFSVIGGFFQNDAFGIITNEGLVQVRNGNLCDGQPGQVQVFLYKVSNPDKVGDWQYTQTKLDNPEEYILSEYSQVPPGDCIIVEFGPEKETTDKICSSYQLAIDQGDLRGS